MTASEIWKPVKGWPDYQVSNRGRVRSSRPWVRGNRPPRILKPAPGSHGYLTVKLYPMKNGYRTTCVHVLVCTAFHGSRPSPKHEVAHWDGVYQNCRADNLRWATESQNQQDRVRHGRTNRGTRCAMAKINERTVKTIRRRLRDGLGPTAIARQMGLTRGIVKSIKRGASWAWLPDETASPQRGA